MGCSSLLTRTHALSQAFSAVQGASLWESEGQCVPRTVRIHALEPMIDTMCALKRQHIYCSSHSSWSFSDCIFEHMTLQYLSIFDHTWSNISWGVVVEHDLLFISTEGWDPGAAGFPQSPVTFLVLSPGHWLRAHPPSSLTQAPYMFLHMWKWICLSLLCQEALGSKQVKDEGKN